jgi:hypothetical protein
VRGECHLEDTTGDRLTLQIVLARFALCEIEMWAVLDRTEGHASVLCN